MNSTQDFDISPEIRELYQELIMDHGHHPKNFHVLETPSCQAEGYNPLCGDKVELYLIIEQNKIKQASFQGQGCAISTASASLMTEALVGKTLEEAEHLFQSFTCLVTDLVRGPESPPFVSELGKLKVLAGVRRFPARVKCATLAWHTLLEALKKVSKSESLKGKNEFGK